MGIEIPDAQNGVQDGQPEQQEDGSLSSRPSIFIVGSPSVGKRAILTRLVSLDAEDITLSSSEITCHGWTIDTKYYTADVCVWMAHLCDKASENARSLSKHCDALVMVFDLSNSSSFEVLQDWVSEVDLHMFEILLCVGNKADLLPSHPAHAEYRRKVQKRGESSSDPHPEFWDYGIDRSEGCSLLNEDDETSEEIQRSCIEWCNQNNIEYIEACAINDGFDKCLSINGDSQGINRIQEALTAHMWPGMVIKSQSKSTGMPVSPKKQEFSDDDSEYEIEYELLSNGSAEPWDGVEDPWVAVNNGTQDIHITDERENIHESQNVPVEQPSNIQAQEQNACASILESNGSVSQTPVLSIHDGNHSEATTSLISIVTEQGELEERTEHSIEDSETRERREPAFDDLEQLMHEMARMRENLRLIPDPLRKEMAGRLAMKMASIFSDDEENEDLD